MALHVRLLAAPRQLQGHMAGCVCVCVCVVGEGRGGGICDGHVQVELSCIVCHLLGIKSMLPMFNWLLSFTSRSAGACCSACTHCLQLLRCPSAIIGFAADISGSLPGMQFNIWRCTVSIAKHYVCVPPIVLATCVNQQDEHGRRLQLQPQSKLLRLTRLCQQVLQRPHSSIMHVLSGPPLRFRAVNIRCNFLQIKASSVLPLSSGLARHCQVASRARLSLCGRSSACDKLLAKRQASKAVSKSHTCESIREAKRTEMLKS